MRDWLIRTQSKKILGPIEREKVLEFLEKGSLAPDDEVCKGSGFWFFIRERELVDEHLYDRKPSVISEEVSEVEDVERDDSTRVFCKTPTSADLEFPAPVTHSKVSAPVPQFKVATPKAKAAVPEMPVRKTDRFLFPIVIASLVILMGVLFLYRKVLKEPLPLIENKTTSF